MRCAGKMKNCSETGDLKRLGLATGRFYRDPGVVPLAEAQDARMKQCEIKLLRLVGAQPKDRE